MGGEGGMLQLEPQMPPEGAPLEAGGSLGRVCTTEFPLMGSPQTDILGTGQKQQAPLPLLYCGCGSLNSSHSPNCLLCLLPPPFPASSPSRSQSVHQHSHLQSSPLLNNFSHLQQVKSFGEIRRENRRLALPRASDPVTMRCSETFLYCTEHKMEREQEPRGW